MSGNGVDPIGIGRSGCRGRMHGIMKDWVHRSAIGLGGSIGTVIGYVAAVDLTIMTLVTVVDVIGRYMFNSPLVGADELTAFALGILVFVSLPLLVARNGLIRVDVLFQVVPRSVGRILNGIASAVSGVTFLFIAWRLFLKAQSLASYGDATMFLHIQTAPLAYVMSAMCFVSGGLMLLLAVVKSDPSEKGSF